MKKSKALDILQNFFQSDCAFENPHDARISADRILEMVEKEIGMIPPFMINPKYRHMNSWEYADMCAFQDLYLRNTNYEKYELNEWEEEEKDEEN